MATDHPGAQVEASGGGAPPPCTEPSTVNLEFDQIQGNIFGGFNKDHALFIPLQITDRALAAAALRPTDASGEPLPNCLFTHVAHSSSEQVLAFNEQFRALRRANLKPEEIIQATWTNIVFTESGMKKLKATDDDGNKTDVDITAFPAAFTQRMENRQIGDVGENAPSHWNNGVNVHINWPDVDAMILLASDDASQLERTNPNGRLAHYLAVIEDPATSGLHMLGIIRGETRVDSGEDQVGHEHFGFKDGVSQPGVRGVDSPDDPLHNPSQGNPGQDLLQPGEFVLGYPRQNPFAKLKENGSSPGETVDGPNPDEGAIAGQEEYDASNNVVPMATPLPPWTKNGSFFVFRRLAQNVKGFRDEVADKAASLGISADLLGAKLVGRYRSGAPLEALKFQSGNGEYQPPMVDPGAANPALANSNTLNNDFEYGDDSEGKIVPFAAHIRKVYPRDQVPTNEGRDAAGNPIKVATIIDVTKDGEAESRTQTHRLLRRGIQFGGSLGAAQGGGTNDPRGLLFAAYQTDIERQFEFVQKTWVNDPMFPVEDAGQDPIIANDTKHGAIKGCPFHALADKSQCPALSFTHFVKTRGGGYFFSPAIDVLETWLK